MTFASPYFLLLLIPWLGVSIWLLLGQRPVEEVPFVPFWRGPVHPPRQKRWLYPPPASIVLGILAMLAVVLGASRPEIHRTATPDPKTPPSTQPDNAKITYAAARLAPVPEIMVKTIGKGAVVIETSGRNVTRSFDSATETADFIPVPDLSDRTTIRLQGTSETWRVNVHQSWPILEPRGSLPPEILRMVETYQHRRRPGDGSKPLAIVTSLKDAGPGPAIVVPTVEPKRAREPARWSNHPIVRSVHADLFKDAWIVPAPGDWTAVAWIGQTPFIAVRETPSRQVWVGLSSPNAARSVEFVMFWTDVIDWAGQGGQEVTVISPTPASSSPESTANKPATITLSGALIGCALGLLVLSAVVWGRGERRAAAQG